MAILGTATGTINAVGDHDWFKLNLDVNTLYSLTSTDGHFFVMHDANGNVIPGADASGGGSIGQSRANGISFMPITSGTYFVDISGRQGSYDLSLADVADDYRSNITTSGTVALGSTVGGTLNAPGDHDWIRVSLTANTLYSIRATGDTQIRVLDATGGVIPSADSFGSLGNLGVGQPIEGALGFMPVTGGNFYIDVSSLGSVSNYSISVAASLDDFRSNTSTLGAVQVSAPVTGNINVPGDHDWFKVSLQADRLYALGVSSRTALTITVMDSNGQSVGTLDSAGIIALPTLGETGPTGIGFTPTVAGDYFIDVSGGGSGAYTLSVDLSSDDYANNTTTSGALSVGGTATGTINTRGDHDWLRVNLAANTLYAITAPSVPTGRLTMFDASGQVVRSNDAINYANGDANGITALGFMPTTGGIYYIDYSSPAVSASYSIALATSADDYTNNIGTSGSVVPGGSSTGTLNVVGDHDWFRVILSAGTLYSIFASGLTASSLTVRNFIGSEVGTLDAYGSDTLAFMPTSSGVFYIDLSSSGNIGNTGNYTLNVSTVADDHRNNVSATGSVINLPVNVAGTGGKDTLVGTAGNDVIDGFAGTDTVLYAGVRSNYSLSKTGSRYSLADTSGGDGTDTLQNIERLKFADLGIALDVAATQSAGKAQLLLGAVLGKDLLGTKKLLVGTGIDLFDQGFTMQQLSGAIMRLDILGTLANGGNATANNTQIANYLLTTVLKVAPGAALLAAGVAALNSETGEMQGNFLARLAETSENQIQVGLVGLAATGLEFGF